MSILYDFNKATEYRKVLIPWVGKTLKMDEGTPVSASGAIANDGTAIGILAAKLTYSGDVRVYPDGNYYAEGTVLTNGYVDIAAAEQQSGITYTDAMKAALSGITFVKGQLDKPTAAQLLPAVKAVDNGKVLKVVNGAWTAAQELPTITAEDDGKVLKVVNGVWTAVAEETAPAPEGDPEGDPVA